MKKYWLEPVERFKCETKAPNDGEKITVYIRQSRGEMAAHAIARCLACGIGWTIGSAIGTAAAKITQSLLR